MRDSINLALQIIGLDGLMGVTVNAATRQDALGKIVKIPAGNRAQLLAELKRQRLVQVTKNPGNFTFQLTPKGIHRLQQVGIDNIKIPKIENWDKKWRIVLFNVPLRYRKQRQAFTNQLRQLDFQLVRDGAWAHPYPCFNQIITIAQHYNIVQFITLSEASKLDEASFKKLLRNFPILN